MDEEHWVVSGQLGKESIQKIKNHGNSLVTACPLPFGK